jgi:hypothetical protein
MTRKVLVQSSVDPSLAGSWSPSGAPVSGDLLYFRNSSADFTDGLFQPTVKPAAMEFELSFSGTAGDASEEFRIGPEKLAIGRLVGLNVGQVGSTSIVINNGEDPCQITVFGTQTTAADPGYEPFRWRGTNVNNTLTVHGGTVGIATNRPDDEAILASVNLFGGTVTLGEGCRAGDIRLEGQTNLTIYGEFDSIRQIGGTVFIDGVEVEAGEEDSASAGEAGDIQIQAGTMTDKSTAYRTTVTVFEGATYRKYNGGDAVIDLLELAGTLDLSQATGSVTINSFQRLSNSARIIDPGSRLIAPAGIVNGSAVTRLDGIELGGGATVAITY